MTDKDLIAIASGFRSGVLGTRSGDRMCFVVSAPLQAYLSFLSVETRLMENDSGETNHVWLGLTDGRVLDPTIDQFGSAYPKVYLGEPLAIHFNGEVMKR